MGTHGSQKYTKGLICAFRSKVVLLMHIYSTEIQFLKKFLERSKDTPWEYKLGGLYH